MTLTLVLGGARSGKSRYAQEAAEAFGLPKMTLVATAQAFDEEMRERIARHQADRDSRWRTVEAPLDLAGALAVLEPDDVAVVDCLTLWLTNLMLGEKDVAAETEQLLLALSGSSARIWLVSNEVGWGLVPETPLGRVFRDEAGRLHQRLAAIADEVVLLVAGLPMVVKPKA